MKHGSFYNAWGGVCLCSLFFAWKRMPDGGNCWLGHSFGLIGMPAHGLDSISVERLSSGRRDDRHDSTHHRADLRFGASASSGRPAAGSGGEIYRRVLAQHPGHADALHMLGILAQQVGKHDVAVDLMGQAIAANPGVPEAYSNLAVALTAMGRHDEAVAACRGLSGSRATIPTHTTISATPCAAWGGQMKRSFTIGKPSFSGRITRTPTPISAAAPRKDRGEFAAAAAAYREAITLNPGSAGAHSNLGLTLNTMGQVDEAIACYQRAGCRGSRTTPRRTSILESRALSQGNFREGWAGYEWRWKCAGSRSGDFPQPLWDGELGGQTILLYAEQGVGDVISFGTFRWCGGSADA